MEVRKLNDVSFREADYYKNNDVALVLKEYELGIIKLILEKHVVTKATGVTTAARVIKTLKDYFEPDVKNFTRYTAVLGFNTKQWWAYDEKKDVYIDPPKEVLDSLPDWRDDIQASEEAFQKILDTNPSWLKDKAYTYKDIEI